jgi:hypothetical protein
MAAVTDCTSSNTRLTQKAIKFMADGYSSFRFLQRIMLQVGLRDCMDCFNNLVRAFSVFHGVPCVALFLLTARPRRLTGGRVSVLSWHLFEAVNVAFEALGLVDSRCDRGSGWCICDQYGRLFSVCFVLRFVSHCFYAFCRNQRSFSKNSKAQGGSRLRICKEEEEAVYVIIHLNFIRYEDTHK